MATPAAPIELPRLPFPLQDAEQILLLSRRHWWFLWPRSIFMALVAIVPVIVVTLLLDAIGILDDLSIFYWIVVALWLAYWAVRLFLNWYRYNNDIWLVTNQRLIDSYKAHPFNLRVSSADLVNVQDMSVVKSGVVASMLGFGDVVCETAGGSSAKFTISGVPRPESMQLLIDRERDRERMRRA